jgi:predicted membrane protein
MDSTNNNRKRFSYLEGYPLLVYITVVGLFFWNFTEDARVLMDSLLSTNIFIILLFTIYNLLIMLGGLFLIFVLVSDIIDSLFEGKNENNLNYKTQKTVILSVVIAVLAMWFFAYFQPKQECITDITLSSNSTYTHNSEGVKKKFKSRDDALDYCMAQHLVF